MKWFSVNCSFYPVVLCAELINSGSCLEILACSTLIMIR